MKKAINDQITDLTEIKIIKTKNQDQSKQQKNQ
jgi:hypothetical protein